MPTATPVVFAGAGQTRRRLFCFPFAGGAAATFRNWPRTLPDDVDVIFVQLPGRTPGDKQVPLKRVSAMVTSALPLIEANADLPYSLFGHSMGSVVAYEVAAVLEQRAANGVNDHSPAHLYVSARRAPDSGGGTDAIGNLPDTEFITAINQRYGGVPEVVLREPDLMALLLPMLRADVEAFETYERFSDHRVGCGLSAFGGATDPHASADELAQWSAVAKHSASVDVFPGGHFYINDEAEALTAKIAERWPAPAVR